MTKLPHYFYNLNTTLPNGMTRWVDPYATSVPNLVLPHDYDVQVARQKIERDIAYCRWLASFFCLIPNGECHSMLKPKMLKWQAIRILSFKHSESSSNDWWEKYQDAVFRVFVEPETVYDQNTGEHKQWYLLSPEDGYLVNRHEMELAGKAPHIRDHFGREKHLPLNKELRKARLVPVECCHHLRHETTGGELPDVL